LSYPAAARGQGAEGTAVVRFTVMASGRVVSASLVRSAGHPALDAAALGAARGTMPPAPAGMTQSQVTVTAPLRFDMR
jgi:protein TonB